MKMMLFRVSSEELLATMSDITGVSKVNQHTSLIQYAKMRYCINITQFWNSGMLSTERLSARMSKNQVREPSPWHYRRESNGQGNME